MSQSHPVVSVVLGSYNRLAFLKKAIESARVDMGGMAGEIIVVDGGSTDGSVKWLTAQKDIITIIQHNRGNWYGKTIRRRSWGYFMNLAFKCAQGKYVCMISDDSLLVPGALKNGIQLAEQKMAAGEKIGAVAFYWRNWPEQKDYWVGLTLGRKMFVNHGLYLNDALKNVNYIDEENYPFYYADGDLCLRMDKAGWKIVDSVHSYVEHYNHANISVRQSNLELGSFQDYIKRWPELATSEDQASHGGWMTRSYQDPAQTWKKMAALHRKEGAKRLWSRLREKSAQEIFVYLRHKIAMGVRRPYRFILPKEGRHG